MRLAVESLQGLKAANRGRRAPQAKRLERGEGPPRLNNAYRHRPRRHEDRRHRDRRRARARAPARAGAAGRLRRTIRAIADLVAALGRTPARARHHRHRHSGAISAATGLVKNANSTWIIGKPLDRDLERALGQPVRARATTPTASRCRKPPTVPARARRRVFGVIIGTGTGGGIVVDGRVLEGRHRIAGEWGHNPLPWPTDRRAARPAVLLRRARLHRDVSVRPGTSADLRAAERPAPDAPKIAALADAGDEAASRALDIYEGRMARALASIINVLDPDVIVLGGGLSNIERLYTNVPALWKPLSFPIRPIHLLCPPCTATRAESGAPPGYGKKEKPNETSFLRRSCSWRCRSRGPSLRRASHRPCARATGKCR